MASLTANTMSERPSLDALLAHAPWVRNLARSLVVDQSAADDLVQDTWAAALQRPPDSGAPLRGWLATVLRRRARQGRREAARRQRREQRAARPEAEPPTSDIVERAALHGDIVQAVLALHEPYRTAILMRFFDGHPPREIASQQGVPVATVNSRITRGLELLRSRLDDQHGDRGAWLLLVTPLLRKARLGPAAAIGATIMHTYLKVGLVVCTGAVGLLFLKPWGGPEAGVPEQTVPGTGELMTADFPETGAEPLPGMFFGDREVIELPDREPSSATAERTVRGVVLDVLGTPLANVPVGWILDRGMPGPQATRSGLDGSFELPVTRPGHALITVDPTWITVLAGTPWVAGREEAVLVIAPRIEVSGAVVDEEGRALAGVSLSNSPPFELGSDFGRVLDNSLLMNRETSTDERGNFHLVVPALPRGTLQFRAEGFATHVEPLPEQNLAGLQVSMHQVRPAEGSLRGVVTDQTGAVVPGARVSNGVANVRTDLDGTFALDIADLGSEEKIVAVHPGFMPAFAEAQPGADGELHWPEFLYLQLGADQPLSISGRVVDADGQPMAGIKVWIADPTYFGQVDRTVLQVETMVAGSTSFWAFERTGSDGTFVLGGLLDRSYRLGAIDPGNLIGTDAGPVPAGTAELEIRMPTDAVYETLEGRVVTRHGEPLADVLVSLSHMTFETRVPGGTTDAFDESEPVRTDEGGYFLLRDVPRDRIHLRVTGDAVMPYFIKAEDIHNPDAMELVVSARHHVQVELLGDSTRADSVRLPEEDGRSALLRVMRGGASYTNRFAEITDGRSNVISVADSAIAVAFYKDGEEVHRVPLRLILGQVNTVRW